MSLYGTDVDTGAIAAIINVFAAINAGLKHPPRRLPLSSTPRLPIATTLSETVIPRVAAIRRVTRTRPREGLHTCRMPKIKKIGVLTGGGDAPGLNAVIRAVVKAASNAGVEVVGLEDSFDGLIYANKARPLTPRDVTGILRLGGTILGTVNRGNPFAQPITTPEGTFNYADRVIEMFHRAHLDALVCIGGDGTLAISYEFFKKGIPLVGVPKTIDNDIVGTNSSFGFDTAVSFATEAIDRLHTTAEAHRRIMVVEVMGRHAGWIALHAGVAGGAGGILSSETPDPVRSWAKRPRGRRARGAGFSTVR